MDNIDNFAIIDSPGDTEINDDLQLFAHKGKKYSKLIIYILDERKILDANSLGNNKELTNLINLKKEYKLLTHCDDYCKGVKDTEENWKLICKDNLKKNEKNLIEHIQNNFKIKIGENNIIHVVLVDQIKMSDEEIINSLDPEDRDAYENANEEMKKTLIKFYRKGMDNPIKEVEQFIKNEEEIGVKVRNKKELSEIIKEYLPFKYHNVLN